MILNVYYEILVHFSFSIIGILFSYTNVSISLFPDVVLLRNNLSIYTHKYTYTS